MYCIGFFMFLGKLFANKLKIPYICSTTTFAFNQHTAKLMKRSFWELLRMVLGMPRINKKMKMLRDHGYDVRSFISIVQNDNDTNTIVYTSKEFQPMANTFSERYAFVGPSIRTLSPQENNIKDRQVIYISLGTVLNKNREFYNNCINAFAKSDYTVVMSVGEKTEIKSLGIIPNNFVVRNTVDQISVLQTADAFITHSGMNSVSESLYFGVPMVLFPQHSEQKMVANRVAELGAGVLLKGKKRADLAASVTEVLTNLKYEENAKKLSKSLRNAGGAVEAANVILKQAQSAY